MNLYSNRIKAEKAIKNDVYVYDCFSEELKTQIFFILKNLLETEYNWYLEDSNFFGFLLIIFYQGNGGKNF